MGRHKMQVIQTIVLAISATCAFSPPAHAQSDVSALYTSKCAACHGPDGAAATPAGKAVGAHDFHSAEVLNQTDVQLTSTVSAGKNKMPAYAKTLTAVQIKALVDYCRQLGAKK
jgi:mono/diheme cytochrome c family protein